MKVNEVDVRMFLIVSTATSTNTTHTCPPQHSIIEERELHLCVVLEGGPASRRGHIDVGHIERNLHC